MNGNYFTAVTIYTGTVTISLKRAEAVAPERIWKWGSPVRSKSWGGGHRPGAKHRKKFLVVPLHFLALKAQLVVSMSAFVIVSTVLSVSCLLFFYSRCPPCPAIYKSGGHVPPCPMESVPLDIRLYGWHVEQPDCVNVRVCHI